MQGIETVLRSVQPGMQRDFFDDDEHTCARYLSVACVCRNIFLCKFHHGYKEATCLLQLARHRRLIENVFHI